MFSIQVGPSARPCPAPCSPHALRPPAVPFPCRALQPALSLSPCSATAHLQPACLRAAPASPQVLAKSLEVFGLQAVPLSSPDASAARADPTTQQAFICNLQAGAARTHGCCPSLPHAVHITSGHAPQGRPSSAAPCLPSSSVPAPPRSCLQEHWFTIRKIHDQASLGWARGPVALGSRLPHAGALGLAIMPAHAPLPLPLPFPPPAVVEPQLCVLCARAPVRVLPGGLSGQPEGPGIHGGRG